MIASRVRFSALPVARCLRPLGLAALGAWLACGRPTPADDAPASAGQSAPANGSVVGPAMSDEPWVLGGSNSGSINGGNPAAKAIADDVGGFGVNARAGHVAGEGVGRRESISYIELAPYLTVESLFVAGDFRFLRTNTGDLGGSGGAILRRYRADRNAIWGANLYFDVDHTYGAQFQQVGLGFEYLSNRLDNRTNFYIPFGTDTKPIASGLVAGSEQFVGNNLFFSRFTDSTTAASGFDTTFTMPVAGRIAERINLEASAGAYYFRPNGGDLRDFAGPKLRVDMTFVRRLFHLYGEATYDRVNKGLVFVGMDINYWNRWDEKPRLGGHQFHRITEWTRRNWTMVASTERSIEAGITAINPGTGLPYFFEHVDSNFTALPSDGSFERPWTTIQQAQTSPPNTVGDIIYVHAGSVFNTPLVMNDGEIIVGEGTVFDLPVTVGTQEVILPATGKPGGRPNFDLITGTPVTLANNVTLSGFTISSTTNGPAILGSGITNATLQDIDVQDVNNGHGIHFLNSAGLITLDNVNVLRSNPADAATGADLDAFRVEGGTARIIYRDSTIENTDGRAVRITSAGGLVDMRSVLVNSRQRVVGNTDEGVIVQNSSADVVFGPLGLQNGTIDLLNNSGRITFAEPVQLDDSNPNPENPNGFPIQVNGHSGAIVFNPGATVVINHRPDWAIDLRNISGSIRFHDDVTIGPGTGFGVFDGALRWQQNSGAFIMDGLFSVDQAAQAILIGDANPALANLAGSTFTMNGLFNITNGSLFSTGDIEILNDPSVVTFNGGTDTDRTLKNFLTVQNTTGAITFNGDTVVSDTFAAFSGAVNITGATGPVLFNRLSVTDIAAVANAQSSIFVNNSGDITFNELNVDISGGTLQGAVSIQNSGTITSNGGTIIARGAGATGGGTAGGAIRLVNNGRIRWVSDSISSRQDAVGILVSGQPGFFIVRGTGQAGSGGSIVANGGVTVGVDTGAIFDYTGQDPTDAENLVELNDMVFNANERAIVATNLNNFVLRNTTVSNTSASNGVLLSDIINVLIEDSTFTSNAGTVVNASIGINPADTKFNYQFLGNSFVDSAASSSTSMIRIDNVGAGAGAELELLVFENGAPTSGRTGFVANRTNPNIANPNLFDEASAFAVRWNGPALVQFERNSFALIGGVGQEGVEFINADSSALTTFNFIENALVANSATDAFGVRFDAAGPAQVNIIGNKTINSPGRPFQGFQMSGLRATAYELTLRNAGNLVRLEDNEITFAGDDSVGFGFPFLGGNTRMNIEGNDIDFTQQVNATAPGERGFNFGPVIGTVFFSGTRNNTVQYAQPDALSSPFPNPFIGSSVGTFQLNGQKAPAGP